MEILNEMFLFGFITQTLITAFKNISNEFFYSCPILKQIETVCCVVVGFHGNNGVGIVYRKVIGTYSTDKRERSS